jgi:hypothetical protein
MRTLIEAASIVPLAPAKMRMSRSVSAARRPCTETSTSPVRSV